ncbi:MAG: hypothetical protein QNJ41_05680 [Xenococcaceae cyanobacterium MO_188.B32]|nr:hypothetical protein [Xenococcaceae cyanobacterium MO_188.B32]
MPRASTPIPDFTERKAIKGLRAFSQDDAEIFAQLQRDRAVPAKPIAIYENV